MKRFFACLILLVTGTVVAQAVGPSDRRIFALPVLKEYAPNGYDVIATYDSTPWKYALPGRSIEISPADFMVFVRGSSELDIVANLPTAVHETCHNFAQKMPWYYLTKNNEAWRDCFAIPLQRNEVSLVTLTPTFPAKEIAGRIPTNLREIRYDIYVNSKTKDQTTQQYGVYGLLDEFNAYQQGTRTALDLQGWYAKSNTPDAWSRWLTSVEGLYGAHGQFKLYILAWLAEARDKHPEMYRAFLKNQTALRTFLRTDELFAATIARYRTVKPAAMARVTNDFIKTLDVKAAEAYQRAFAEIQRYAAIEREVRAAAR